MKQKYLDVPKDELDEFGAVSKEVALSMVRGLKKLPTPISASQLQGLQVLKGEHLINQLEQFIQGLFMRIGNLLSY